MPSRKTESVSQTLHWAIRTLVHLRSTLLAKAFAGQSPSPGSNWRKLPVVRLYLDLCCLKRPFDAQDQALVRLQTEAVVSILALPGDRVQFIRSPAQALENSFNPVQARREAVDLWLGKMSPPPYSDELLSARIADLLALGFKSFDAFHLASAELLGADVLLTVDLPFLKLASRLSAQLRVRVVDPVKFLEEIAQWTH